MWAFSTAFEASAAGRRSGCFLSGALFPVPPLAGKVAARRILNEKRPSTLRGEIAGTATFSWFVPRSAGAMDSAIGNAIGS